MFTELFPVYTKNHMKSMHTKYAQNAELLDIKGCGIYQYHSALKG
jgi:hypothetical protein